VNPRFYALSYGRRVDVEFFISDGGAEMIYERYRMVRSGSC